MWSNKHRHFFPAVLILISNYEFTKCNAITNTNLNNSVREYSVGDGTNVSHVQTLQKEDLEKHAYYVPAGNPIKFKEISDSALSGSSHSRGLAYNNHPGYAAHDYEEAPHYDFGHDYQLHDPHTELHGHVPHGYEHHDFDPHHYDPHAHHGGYHHYDHGPYLKHHKHALATKAALWPLAGLALLGAAAALVSNPVLLQLGVISGKRRRRDTEEITGPDVLTDSFKLYAEKIKKQYIEANIKNDDFKRRLLKPEPIQTEKPNNANFKKRTFKANHGNDVKRVTRIKGLRPSVISVNTSTTSRRRYGINDNDDDKFIPVPIKLRSPKLTEP